LYRLNHLIEGYCSAACRIENRAKTGYMRKYYSVNTALWEKRQHTREYRDAKNAERRKRYAEDAEYRERAKAKVKKYQQEHVDIRMGQRMKKFGITYADYKAMHDKQAGKCAICGAEIGDVMGNRLYVDHDHATGSVRGLLCSACNFGIGKFKDSPLLLRKAAEYLEG